MTKKRTLLDIAKIDLETAKTMFTREDDEMFLNICAYQSHQCIEKLLKYICYSRGIDPGRTHEIGDILQDLNDPVIYERINPYVRPPRKLVFGGFVSEFFVSQGSADDA